MTQTSTPAPAARIATELAELATFPGWDAHRLAVELDEPALVDMALVDPTEQAMIDGAYARVADLLGFRPWPGDLAEVVALLAD